MNRLEKLITEMCPDGVEYKKLGYLEDAGKVVLGRGNVISKNYIRDNQGDYPVFSSAQTNNGVIGYCNTYMFDDIRLTWSIDGGGKFFYRDNEKYSVTNVCGWLKVLDEDINPKFLYYALMVAWKNKVFDYIHKAHPSVIREEYEIPIPPLAIQQEIVKILDAMTELEKELEKELENRRKQYEYYRDELLSLESLKKKNGGVLEVKRLGDVCIDFIVPMRDKPKEFKGNIPWCRIEDIENYSIHGSIANLGVTQEVVDSMNLKIFPVDTLIVSCSASLGVFAINTVPLITNQTFIGIVCGVDILNKYLLYYFSANIKMFDKMATKGTIPYISRQKFENLEIPVPSLEVQQEIVDILDAMGPNSASLQDGLRTEIKARMQQYEYYRDKLLSFKRKV